jgi:formylglycine-generating enzyme required for sulfatase activity
VFALDESPYGVRAMAGTIAEWVSYPGKRERRFCTRGGSWADNELDCRLSSRRFCDASLRSSRVGMRLVRAVDGRDLTSIRPTTEA